LPQVIRGDGRAFFRIEDQFDDQGVVLFLYINFAISGRNVRGYIAMLMDLRSLDALRTLIREFIERVMGSDDLNEISRP
jgi:chemotaxis protein CheC